MLATKEQVKKWEFFCKEVAKANDTLDAIEAIFKHINIHDNAYNPFFALVIDALTTKVFLNLGHLFDSQNDSLRLTRIISNKVDIAKIETLKLEAEPFINARHKQHAHISNVPGQVNYGSNFRLMNDFNASKIKEILDGVSKILRRWGVSNNDGTVIADRWGNIATSTEVLFEHLREYEYIRSKMPIVEHLELVEGMRSSETG